MGWTWCDYRFQACCAASGIPLKHRLRFLISFPVVGTGNSRKIIGTPPMASVSKTRGLTAGPLAPTLTRRGATPVAALLFLNGPVSPTVSLLQHRSRQATRSGRGRLPLIVVAIIHYVMRQTLSDR